MEYFDNKFVAHRDISALNIECFSNYSTLDENIVVDTSK